eukprot:6051915-Pyramimonas_sp.AAC.1
MERRAMGSDVGARMGGDDVLWRPPVGMDGRAVSEFPLLRPIVRAGGVHVAIASPGEHGQVPGSRIHRETDPVPLREEGLP